MRPRAFREKRSCLVRVLIKKDVVSEFPRLFCRKDNLDFYWGVVNDALNNITERGNGIRKCVASVQQITPRRIKTSIFR